MDSRKRAMTSSDNCLCSIGSRPLAPEASRSLLIPSPEKMALQHSCNRPRNSHASDAPILPHRLDSVDCRRHTEAVFVGKGRPGGFTGLPDGARAAIGDSPRNADVTVDERLTGHPVTRFKLLRA